jgi:hypothetical protein
VLKAFGSDWQREDRTAAISWTFDAQLEEDEFHMRWLNTPNLVTGKRQGRYLLSAVLKVGWHIVKASPEEQALLGAHGLASGRVQ